MKRDDVAGCLIGAAAVLLLLPAVVTRPASAAQLPVSAAPIQTWSMTAGPSVGSVASPLEMPVPGSGQGAKQLPPGSSSEADSPDQGTPYSGETPGSTAS